MLYSHKLTIVFQNTLFGLLLSFPSPRKKSSIFLICIPKKLFPTSLLESFLIGQEITWCNTTTSHFPALFAGTKVWPYVFSGSSHSWNIELARPLIFSLTCTNTKQYFPKHHAGEHSSLRRQNTVYPRVHFTTCLEGNLFTLSASFKKWAVN